MGKSNNSMRKTSAAIAAVENLTAARKKIRAINDKLQQFDNVDGNRDRLKSIENILSVLESSELTINTSVGGLRSQKGAKSREGDECVSSIANDSGQPQKATNNLSNTVTADLSESDNGIRGFFIKKVRRLMKLILEHFVSVVKCIFNFVILVIQKPRKLSKSNFFGVFFSILAFVFYFELHTPPGFTRMWLKWENVELRSVECTIESPNFAMELFRPPVSCEFCHQVSSADRISGISPADFERLYAYSGRPVVISDGMVNWTAPSSFDFQFLKSIYGEGSRSLEHLGDDCLFFPYVTEFRSLGEVFNMSKERFSNHWYIGWSNCDAETSHILRQHYQRPYFLPETAESTHADWIFMGTPGYGAHMHIDHVINPSWQAQIKGRKRWFLQPPPECFYECSSFAVDVYPGDIIVLDTNKWYHQTQILPGDLSITIGSEYD